MRWGLPRPGAEQSVDAEAAEFFLPPSTDAGLWRETAALLLGSLAFVIILAIIVALSQGIALKV